MRCSLLLPPIPSPPQFAWTHITLLIVVSQAYLAVQNCFEGLYWFVLAVSMVICNDIMAYLFGMCAHYEHWAIDRSSSSMIAIDILHSL